MHVGHRRQRVDLEVFVRSEGCGVLDGSPVGEGRLRVVEPLVAQFPD